jgi:hypothetical protein
VTIEPTSFGGTEDCEGVAFDIQDGITWPAGLTVTDLTILQSIPAPGKPFETPIPPFLIGNDLIDGKHDMGIDASGNPNIKTPFDVGEHACVMRGM